MAWSENVSGRRSLQKIAGQAVDIFNRTNPAEVYNAQEKKTQGWFGPVGITRKERKNKIFPIFFWSGFC